MPIDYCARQPPGNQCLNGGTCRNLPETASTACDCPPGYSGQFCQDDIDECQINNPCVNAEGCSNHVSFSPLVRKVYGDHNGVIVGSFMYMRFGKCMVTPGRSYGF